MRRLIASGVEMDPKEPKYGCSIFATGCSKVATLTPFPPRSVNFTCQTFSHKFSTLFKSRAIPLDRHAHCSMNRVRVKRGDFFCKGVLAFFVSQQRI